MVKLQLKEYLIIIGYALIFLGIIMILVLFSIWSNQL